MRIALAHKYSFLLEKKGVKKASYLFLFFFQFVRDAYDAGKLSEIISFIVWEVSHRLRLFPQKKYLRFDNSEALLIENERLDDLYFSENINRFFLSRELRIIRSSYTWKIRFSNNNEEVFGCLIADDKTLYKSIDKGKSIIFIKRFPESITSIFISSQNRIFIGIKGAVYHSLSNASSFEKSLNLSFSNSYIWHDHGMTETPDKVLVLGEYGGENVAYLYSSSDNGETWGKSNFLIKKGINKHVHLVRYSKLLNKILVTDGDNKKKLWVSDSLNSFELKNHKWKLVNKFHIQMGGHTSMAETDEQILLGTDYLGGTNFIIETIDCEKFNKRIVPDPYRRSPVMEMVQRKSKKGNEIWVILHNSICDNTKCLLMYTVNDGKSWSKIIEYNGTTHIVSLISASNEISDILYFSITTALNSKKTKSVVYKILD